MIKNEAVFRFFGISYKNSKIVANVDILDDKPEISR
jgi:hypothetical protein